MLVVKLVVLFLMIMSCGVVRMIGRLVFVLVSVSVILFGLFVFVFVNWLVSGLIFDVVVVFLWCISENIMLVGLMGLLLWNVMFLCSLMI